MTEIYVDITQYIKNRLNTGIQRVVKEYLYQAIQHNSLLYVLCYDNSKKCFSHIPHEEVLLFLDDVSSYIFKKSVKIDIFEKSTHKKIFFDIDSVWNADLQREFFYAKLKKNDFFIYNFIYDLIPILFPQFMYATTRNNFTPYINAILRYSDFVFFDSYSASHDFTNIQKKSSLKNKIKKKVIYLGSDFTKLSSTKKHTLSPKYENLLLKKYILFVGTFEPRKNQSLMLDAFDELSQKYPELHLIFIGKIGWNVERIISRIDTHPLKNKRVLHLQNIDDVTLKSFYESAYIVAYLSHYEGYGLPVVESLLYGNITIVSKNSSMPEVGGKYADYIENDSKEELTFLCEKYVKNSELYSSKKKSIQSDYKSHDWATFYGKISKYLI